MGKGETLNQKETAFCYEYIANRFNGVKAYLKVYDTDDYNTAGVLANRLLKKVKIQNKIKELTESYLTELSYTANDVLKEIALMAFSDISNHMTFDGKKHVLKSFEETGASTACIREFNIDETETVIDENVSRVDRKIKFKLHDKKGSLELLGKNLLLFADRIKIDDKDDIDAAFRTLAEGMRAIDSSTPAKKPNAPAA